jgi:hypothetical protein
VAALWAAGAAQAQEVAAAGDADAGLSGWQHAFQVPESLGGKPSTNATVANADLLVWTPAAAKRIRSVFVVPNNTDSKGFAECPPLRRAAAKAEMGVLYMRTFDPGIEWERKTAPDITRLPALLDYVAEKTGVAEFRHAPWITFGKSSRGSFPFRAAWMWPERTIATVTYHGETPTWPVAEWARLGNQTIMQVNANGETEWGGTWYRHVRPSLLNYRARRNWMSHQVVAWGVGHGDYPEETSGKGNPTPRQSRPRVWEYLALFIAKANELRVPKDKYPTNGPVELKTVDEAGGYVIDPFAVEDLFFQPHCPLPSSPDGYLVGDAGETGATGYAAIPPAAEAAMPEGVPVVPLAVGQSPAQWLVTDGLRFAMKNDPMTDLGGLEKLRPKPGDEINVDGTPTTFRPAEPKLVPSKGGLAVGAMKKSGAFSVLAYTVLSADAPVRLKVKAPFSVAGRLQIVLNGVAVDHRQVVDLQKGLYPMLVVLRLNGVSWASIEPLFEAVGDAELAQAKEAAVEKAKRTAEWEKLRAAGPKPASALIRKAADVPEAERKKMFWVADREQAEAWFKLHALKGQMFDVP